MNADGTLVRPPVCRPKPMPVRPAFALPRLIRVNLRGGSAPDRQVITTANARYWRFASACIAIGDR
jgi:hypothetical protein